MTLKTVLLCASWLALATPALAQQAATTATTAPTDEQRIEQLEQRLTEIQAELEDYTIHSVTQGTDAQGEVHVVLKQGELTASGRGVSTGIVEASAKAYLDAINRLVSRKVQERKGNIVID